MIESIIFEVLSQNKKVSTLSLINEYNLSNDEVKRIERELFVHEQIITSCLLICEECGAVINNGVFFKSLKETEYCYICNAGTPSSNKVLIFSKKKLNKND